MNILLVDDHAGFRESVAESLRMRRHLVIEASTSQEALEFLLEVEVAEDRIQVVITDYDLGLLSDEDGDKFLQRVKFIAPTLGTALWSGLWRDECDDADFQTTKDRPDELIDWLKVEEATRNGS